MGIAQLHISKGTTLNRDTDPPSATQKVEWACTILQNFALVCTALQGHIEHHRSVQKPVVHMHTQPTGAKIPTQAHTATSGSAQPPTGRCSSLVCAQTSMGTLQTAGASTTPYTHHGHALQMCTHSPDGTCTLLYVHPQPKTRTHNTRQALTTPHIHAQFWTGIHNSRGECTTP